VGRKSLLDSILKCSCLFASIGCGLVVSPTLTALRADAASSVERLETHSNQTPSGSFSDGELFIALEVREGEWFPEDEKGPSVKIYALGERGKPATVPGPMIRVPEGTSIHVQIRNRLAVEVTVHGMHSRPGKAEDVIKIPPGQSSESTFQAGAAGAYYYWATAGGDTLNGRPYKEDSQMSGAFIVDPEGRVTPDRVFVIGAWRDRLRPDESLDLPVVNGKSWPYTERLEYTAGSDVRWRWLNASAQTHPMHMHGSYFRVDSIGDAERDTALSEGQRKTVATQLMQVGGTMTTYWQPKEPGRWLFHCHILAHVSPDTMLFRQPPYAKHGEMGQHDLGHEMAGLVMGITVAPHPGERSEVKLLKPRHKLDLVIEAKQNGKNPEGYSLSEHGKARGAVSAPGPALVLTRGEPVAIHITNRLTEPTSIHWHGIELQSYYDGVPGWTGIGPRVTPMIQPGKSFDVQFTPPRAGTFIYHTHMNDIVQLGTGLYGPIVVLDPGEKYHPETDRIFLISRTGIRRVGEMLVNGSTKPDTEEWRQGATYRLRFININANNTVVVSLKSKQAPATWKSIAKDGADLPVEQAVTGPASFLIAPGETYDFQVHPEHDGDMQLIFFLTLFNETVALPIRVGSTIAQK
jgi:FtsP/CotA-like multicopper oxidase with cupredoxin domain